MDNLLPYIVKFTVIFGILLGFFALVLRKETLHHFKRLFLLSIPIVSLLAPLVSFRCNKDTVMHTVSSSIPSISINTISATKEAFPWQQILSVVILVISTILFISTMVGAIKVFQIIRQSSKRPLSIGTLCDTTKPISPFSFFDFIVLHQPSHTTQEMNQIIEHEQVHVYQKHVFDMLIAQLLCVFAWWNPFVWIYRHLVIENLKFIVDQEVLRTGTNNKHYQLSILSTSVYDSSMVFATHFNHSLIKNRIQMMNKQLSKPKNMWKSVLCLPLLFFVLIALGQSSVIKEQERYNETVQIRTDTIPTETKSTKNGNILQNDADEWSGNKFHRPLIVVNGEIVENRSIDDYPPSRIESINVLEGDKAVKHYGSKGAHGVVEITTKKTIPHGDNYFLDGEKVSRKELTQLDPTQIKTLNNIVLTETGKRMIQVFTKELNEFSAEEKEEMREKGILASPLPPPPPPPPIDHLLTPTNHVFLDGAPLSKTEIEALNIKKLDPLTIYICKEQQSDDGKKTVLIVTKPLHQLSKEKQNMIKKNDCFPSELK